MNQNKTLGAYARRGHFTRLAVLTTVFLLVAAAVPAVSANGASGSTTNAAPTIDNVYFYTSDPSAGSSSTCAADGRATSFDPTAGSTTTVYVCAELSDANGYNDVCDTESLSANETRTFSVTTSADASISDDAHPKTNVVLACQTGSGTSVAATGSFQMEYWRAAASGASGYKVTVSVTDVEADSATPATAQYDYTSLTSLDAATTGALSLGGAIAPGAQGSDATAAIYNKGNTDFTIHVSGTVLTGDGYGKEIAVGNLKWATSADTAYGTKTGLTTTSATTSLSAPAESADGTTARNVYFQLGAPSGADQWIPKDTYAGTVTFATS